MLKIKLFDSFGNFDLICESGVCYKSVVAVKVEVSCLGGCFKPAWSIAITHCSFLAYFHHRHSILLPLSVMILIAFHHSCSEHVPLKIPIIKSLTRRNEKNLKV